MKPIAKDLPLEDRLPKFFPISKDVINEDIPLPVYLYFLDRKRSIQRVPKVLKSEADFDIWHRSKNRELYENPPWEKRKPLKKVVAANKAYSRPRPAAKKATPKKNLTNSRKRK